MGGFTFITFYTNVRARAGDRRIGILILTKRDAYAIPHWHSFPRKDTLSILFSFHFPNFHPQSTSILQI
jgi:hypothetical protein